MQLAREVKARMGRYDVTQHDLSKVLHVSQAQVSKRLRGVIVFDLNELELLARYFNTTAGDLLGAAAASDDTLSPGSESRTSYLATVTTMRNRRRAQSLTSAPATTRRLAAV